MIYQLKNKIKKLPYEINEQVTTNLVFFVYFNGII